jgi:CBS domain-containing membrane protein
VKQRILTPMLAGAGSVDRLRACIGIAVAVAFVGAAGALVHGAALDSPWIVGPVAASAVLVFAVPTSPMAQPWPVVAGNSLSAAVGLLAGRSIGHGTLAAGIAVAFAIGLMSVTRSLTPPGAAVALTAALGGHAIDWWFPLAPVALNSAILVAAGLAFHRFTGHSYPHRSAEGATALPVVALRDEDVRAVLAELGETFDVSPEDLVELVRRLEARLLFAARAPVEPAARPIARDDQVVA